MKPTALFFLLAPLMLVGGGCMGQSSVAPSPLLSTSTERVVPLPVRPANEVPQIPVNAQKVPKPNGY